MAQQNCRCLIMDDGMHSYVEEKWENERYAPTKYKWIEPCHVIQTEPSRWTDRDRDKPRAAVNLPQNWKWYNKWKPALSKNSDEDGWMYGTSFHEHLQKQRGLVNDVRSRKWQRTRVYVGVEGGCQEWKTEQQKGIPHPSDVRRTARSQKRETRRKKRVSDLEEFGTRPDGRRRARSKSFTEAYLSRTPSGDRTGYRTQSDSNLDSVIPDESTHLWSVNQSPAVKSVTKSDIYRVFLCWAFLGFYLSGHWIYISRFGKTVRSACYLHVAFYWVSCVLFWVLRHTMLPWYVSCSGGEFMSARCLFQEQELRFQLLYVLHIILVLFSIVHWLVDACVLSSWLKSASLDNKTPRWNIRIYVVVVVLTAVVCVAYTGAKY